MEDEVVLNVLEISVGEIALAALLLMNFLAVLVNMWLSARRDSSKIAVDVHKVEVKQPVREVAKAVAAQITKEKPPDERAAKKSNKTKTR